VPFPGAGLIVLTAIPADCLMIAKIMNIKTWGFLTLAIGWALTPASSPAESTTITYQGNLNHGGKPGATYTFLASQGKSWAIGRF
jgi:hypothetical protein